MLDDILSDMRTSIERISDQAQIVEANLSKSEHRAAVKARADSSKFKKDVQLEPKAVKEHWETQKAIQVRKGVIFQQSPYCLTSELLLRSRCTMGFTHRISAQNDQDSREIVSSLRKKETPPRVSPYI